MAAKYLTMVGQLQWLVTLGRFDIHAQVATMSRFRAAPRQGHMDRLKRIYSYAIRTKDYAIRFRTELPDYSFLPDQDFDRTYSLYGDVHEILPDDMPEPLGEAETTTTTMDANLNHCLATGKSLTGCLHFVNKNSCGLVFQETSHSGDSYLWFRVCCCQNSNRTDHGHQADIEVSWCSHHYQVLLIW